MRRVCKGRDIDAALCRKGFRREVGGDHIRYYWNGHAKIRTLLSHGMLGCTVDADIISKISRQLRLSKSQFLAFIDCTMSEREYRDLLQQRG